MAKSIITSVKSIMTITAIKTLDGNELTTAIIYPLGSSKKDFRNPDPPSSKFNSISSEIFLTAAGEDTCPLTGAV